MINFDQNYSLFERAARMKEDGYGSRVVVMVQASRTDPTRPHLVSQGIAELMGRFAGIEHLEFLPVETTEPITLNSAVLFRDFLESERVGSVMLLSPGFRSYRDDLVYDMVLDLKEELMTRILFPTKEEISRGFSHFGV